jgi:predicted RNA binding protein YcfA (HicA-like mRNA interferase family)
MSGADVIEIIESFGFCVVSQRGSYIKLQRPVDKNVKQTTTVPNHKEIDKGTLKAIINQLS